MSDINISINNGEGLDNVAAGAYNVTADIPGYVNSTLAPQSITVTESGLEYTFTITADGTLTIHVTDTGETSGTPIVGAKFIRCDSTGQTYGSEIASNSSGDVIFANVPYITDGNDPITIYYKQTASDGRHTFNSDLQNTTLNQQEVTLQLSNPLATQKTFKLTDGSVANLPVGKGTLTLN